MSKRSTLPQRRRHIFIYDEDWAFLDSVYGQGQAKDLGGVGTAIRAVVHAWVERLRAQAQQVIDESEPRFEAGPNFDQMRDKT